jgi:hypothetical protein
MPHVIEVDQDGVDAEGNDYHLYAYDDKVAAGLMKNEPVLVRYPDGRVAEGNRAMVTRKGLELLKREMPMGPTQGNA